jgi:hypothetical protein
VFGDWEPPTAASAYGLSPQPVAGGPTGLASVATPSTAGANAESPFHPDNPLVVFGVVAALTFGLMAFSTSVRVGGTTASMSIGDTK